MNQASRHPIGIENTQALRCIWVGGGVWTESNKIVAGMDAQSNMNKGSRAKLTPAAQDWDYGKLADGCVKQRGWLPYPA